VTAKRKLFGRQPEAAQRVSGHASSRLCEVHACLQNCYGLSQDGSWHYGAGHRHGAGSEHACAPHAMPLMWPSHMTAKVTSDAGHRTLWIVAGGGVGGGREGGGAWEGITRKPQQQATLVFSPSLCSSICWSMSSSLSAWPVCRSPCHPLEGMHRTLGV